MTTEENLTPLQRRARALERLDQGHQALHESLEGIDPEDAFLGSRWSVWEVLNHLDTENYVAALEQIDTAGKGVLLYMRQEGRGIGLTNKIRAYALQDRGVDTVDANTKLGFPPDLRDYGIGAQILLDLGIRKMALLTNNPKKIVGLESYGLELIRRVPIEIRPNTVNADYLKTKRDRLGHLILQDSALRAGETGEAGGKDAATGAPSL